MNLREAINIYFPTEKVLIDRKVNLNDSWSTPLSYSKEWHFVGIDFIETDKKYYFDRRQSYLNNISQYSFIGPFLPTFLLLVIWYFLWNRSLIMLPFIGGFALLSYIIHLSNIQQLKNGLADILVIDKSWMVTRKDLEGKIVLEGQVSTADSISFPFFLTENQQKSLSFDDKFQSGILFLKLFKIKKKGPYGTKFTIT